jgi:sarcosine oxidase, subunit alpha
MLAGAAQTYLGRYGVAVARRAVVATCHDSAWGAAFALAGAGVEVPAIVDLRGEVEPGWWSGRRRWASRCWRDRP